MYFFCTQMTQIKRNKKPPLTPPKEENLLLFRGRPGGGFFLHSALTTSAGFSFAAFHTMDTIERMTTTNTIRKINTYSHASIEVCLIYPPLTFDKKFYIFFIRKFILIKPDNSLVDFLAHSFFVLVGNSSLLNSI